MLWWPVISLHPSSIERRRGAPLSSSLDEGMKYSVLAGGGAAGPSRERRQVEPLWHCAAVELSISPSLGPDWQGFRMLHLQKGVVAGGAAQEQSSPSRNRSIP